MHQGAHTVRLGYRLERIRKRADGTDRQVLVFQGWKKEERIGKGISHSARALVFEKAGRGLQCPLISISPPPVCLCRA